MGIIGAELGRLCRLFIRSALIRFNATSDWHGPMDMGFLDERDTAEQGLID